MISDKFRETLSSKITRRSFFKTVTWIFSGFIALTLGFPMIETLISSATKSGKRSFSKVAALNSIPNRRPVYLSFIMSQEDAFIKNNVVHKVWTVKKSDSDITVFSPICPHLGCRYQWHPDRDLFICPCHHSVFNMEGKVVSGPAPRPLDTLPKKIENDDLYVLWERFKPGISKKEIA
jgi:menaquinol-cytochrome c reductase iron-sulfur subunit